MMAPSRGVCFQGRMFFVYDREAVKKEADPPEDAIVYFYPPATLTWETLEERRYRLKKSLMTKIMNGKAPKYLADLFEPKQSKASLVLRNSDNKLEIPVPVKPIVTNSLSATAGHSADINQQITICGQLVCMANFLSSFTGKRSPALFKLKTEKVAMIHVGKYSLAFGGTLIEPDSLMSRQLETLYRVFAFYHGSIDRVRRMHQERSSFLSNMSMIWDCYLPFVRHYGDHLPGVFDPVPFLDLPKKAAAGFMKASHFLQACQRRRHVLVGCLLYNNSVLCTQLDPDITSRVLLLKPNQSHHPAQPVKTDFALPFGLRILDCFVTPAEYVTVYDALAQSPYRQLNAANSSGTFPDVYSTPGKNERNNSSTETASTQSNVTHSGPHGSHNRDVDVGEEEKPRSENGAKKLDSSEGLCRSGQGEGCELAENGGEENSKDLSLPSSAQVELADDGGSEKRADLDGETVNNMEEKDASVVPKQLVKGETLQCDVCDDKGHSPTSDAALASCEHELVMEAINVQELRVIECCLEESEGSTEQASPIMHQCQAPQASVIGAESHQPTSEQEDVCSEGKSAADCEDTELVSEDSPLDRTVPLAAEAGDVSAARDLESLCRIFLEDIIDEVTAELETRGDFRNVPGAGTGAQDTVLFAAGTESSRGKDPKTCATMSLSNETSSSSGDGVITDARISCETASSLCRCAGACKDSCRDSSVSEADIDCVNKSPVACDTFPSRNRNVKFENNIEVFCVKESVGGEYDGENENQEESKVAEDTGHYLEAQTDSTASSVTHIQSLETDSGVSLNNSDDVTSGAQHQEFGDSDVIAGAASDSGCTSGSSVSRDEEPLEDEEGQDVNQVEGMAHVTLYVQAHSEIVLILLAKPGLKSDQEAIKALWETSLNQLGELEALVKQSVGSTAQSDSKEDYSYLVFDRFEKAMKGNLREPVTQADHVFCDTAKFVHEQFDNCPSLRDVTLRSRSSGVYCKRSLGRETYFQQKAGSFRAVPGVPSPRDPTFTLEKRTSKVLLKEHGINVF